MALKPFRLTKTFVRERCDFCGECFARCPVLEYPLDRAKAEFQVLVDTGDAPALARCTGCMACNTFCPTDANPHTLIVSRWDARYQQQGLPARAALVLPYQSNNLHAEAVARLPEDERALVHAWEANWRRPPESDTMLYAGCNMILQPFLLDSVLFRGVPIFGALDLCCGEPLYRMGCWDAERVVAERLRDEFARMGLKRLLVPCLAGYHLFRQVYPDVFDVRLDCEVVSLYKWLDDRIATGQIPVALLNKRAVIHDNCWPKASGDACFDGVRRLLERIGVEVVEPAHSRESALCCGMCAGAARHSLRDTLRSAHERLRELRDAGADFAVDYCGGCSWLFSLAGQLSFSLRDVPLYHLIELVQTAAGETPKHRTETRTRDVIRTMAGRLVRAYLTPGRFWIRDIAGRPVPESQHTE